MYIKRKKKSTQEVALDRRLKVNTFSTQLTERFSTFTCYKK